MSRPICRMELGFKKLPIDEAILLLQEERSRGATHVAGLRVRWEESPDESVAGGSRKPE